MMDFKKEEMMEKIKAAGLREFGAYNEDLAAKWTRELKEAGEWETPLTLAAALNNNDTSHALLSLLTTKTAEIMAGMKAAAEILGAKSMCLYLPEGEAKLKTALEGPAKEAGITIQEGIVDVRALRGSSINHIETMAALGELCSGSYEPGTCISVAKDGTLGELQKISYGTSVKEIPGVETENCKGICIGSKLYDSAGFDLVIEADTNIGDGVIKSLPDTCCIVDEAQKILLTERKNGCGKCTFCREGLGQLHVMTKEITEGKGKNEFLDMMAEIQDAMPFSCLCSVGQTGADFTKGSLTFFAEEYTDHIKKKRCPNNVCSAFMNIYIDPNLCEGCEECADECPADCIEGKKGFIHMIDEFDCTKCGKCIDVCDYDAVIKTTGRVPKLPGRLTKCGKFKKR